MLPPISKELLSKRAKIAALSRSRAVDDPEFLEVQRDFWAQRLAQVVEFVLAKSPPFTDEQTERVLEALHR